MVTIIRYALICAVITSLPTLLLPAAGGIKTANLANGAVTAAKLANNAVTTVKIANRAITANKLAGSVGTNLFLGTNSGTNNSTGTHNTAVGQSALQQNTTGSDSTAVGYNALKNTQTVANTAFGASALANTTSGYNNTGIGLGALNENTIGMRNVAVGDSALHNNTEGYQNTALGSTALQYNFTGAYNTAIGSNALSSTTSGSSNIALGSGAGLNQTIGNNTIYIGNLGVGAESGIIRLGTTSTHTGCHIAGIYNTPCPDGSIVSINADGLLGITPSSKRFKHDITEISAQDLLKLLELHPVAFKYNQDIDPAQDVQFGLIAEEVAQDFKDLVIYDDNGEPFTVRYHLLVPLLLAALQNSDKKHSADITMLLATLQQEHTTSLDSQKRLEILEKTLNQLLVEKSPHA